MSILQITSLLIVLAGAFGAINYLFLRLPSAIGILVVALVTSFAVIATDALRCLSKELSADFMRRL